MQRTITSATYILSFVVSLYLFTISFVFAQSTSVPESKERWVVQGGTLTLSDNTLRFAETTSTGARSIATTESTPSATKFSLSFDVKTNGGKNVRAYVYDNTRRQTSWISGVCILRDQGIAGATYKGSNASEPTVTVATSTDGFYRCSVSGIIGASSTGAIRIMIAPDGIPTRTNVTQAMYVRNVSLEAITPFHSCPVFTRTLSVGATDATTAGQVSMLQKFLRAYYQIADSVLTDGVYNDATARYVRMFQEDYDLEVVGSMGSKTRVKIDKVCKVLRFSERFDASRINDLIERLNSFSSQLENALESFGSLSSRLSLISTDRTTVYTVPGTTQARTLYCPSPVLSRYLVAGNNDTQSGSEVSKLQKFLTTYFKVPLTHVTGTFNASTTALVAQFQTKEGITSTGTVGPTTRARIASICVNSRSVAQIVASQTGVHSGTTTTVSGGITHGAWQGTGGRVNLSPVTPGQVVFQEQSGTGRKYLSRFSRAIPSESFKLIFDAKTNMNRGIHVFVADPTDVDDKYIGGVCKPQGSGTVADVWSASTSTLPMMTASPIGSDGWYRCTLEGAVGGGEDIDEIRTYFELTGTSTTASRDNVPTIQLKSVSITRRTSAPCNFNGQSVAHSATVMGYRASSVAAGGTCSSQVRSCSNGVLSGTYEFSSCSVSASLGCMLDGKTVSHGATTTAYRLSSVPFGQVCSPQIRSCYNGTLSGTYGFSSCTVQKRSCTLGGRTFLHGATTTAYSAAMAPVGQLCASISQVRTCNDGAMTGSASFSILSCVPPNDPPQTTTTSTTTPCLLDNRTILHGASITAYKATTPPEGSTCTTISQVRRCSNGVLNGSNSYGKATCAAVVPVGSCVLDGVTVPNGSAHIFYRYQSVNPGASCAYRNRLCTNGDLSQDDIFQYKSCTQGTTTAQSTTSLSMMASILTSIQNLLSSSR